MQAELTTTSSSPPAGASPVRVAGGRLGSRLAASGGKRMASKPSVESPIGGATERSVASSEACAVVRGPSSDGERDSRAVEITAKATEAVKTLEVQP